MTTHHNTQPLQGNSQIQLNDIRSALMNEFHFSTSLKEPEKFRISQRAQHIYDITQNEFDWFITLTFRYKKTDHDEVVSLGKKFFDLLSSEIYGKRSRNRIIHYTAIERHEDGSLHIHTLIKEPKPDAPIGMYGIRDLIKHNWFRVASTNLDMTSSGSNPEDSWFEPVREGNILRLAGYMTKDCYRYDDTVIYDLCCLDGRKVG